MRKARVPTIRSRLILLVMACIIPASLAAVALISYNYHQGRAQLVRESMATARAMMSAVDRELATTQAALRGLATSPYLASGNLAAFHAQAAEMLKTQHVLNIVMIDPGAQQIQLVNTLRPFGSKLPVGVVPGLEEAVRAGRPFTSDIFVGPIAKKHLVAVGVPVFRGDKPYVLAAGMFPDRMLELLVQQRFPPDWIAVIFDSSGTIVARTHLTERFVGTKGAPAAIARMREVAEDSLETTSVEGIPILSVFSRSSVSSWTVAIGIPSKDLTDELVRRLWWLVAGTAILLLGSLALAWTIGGRIAGSVHELVAPAIALGSGEAVSVPPLRLREADEVGRALTGASAMLTAARHRANHDVLTGLANRGLFDEILRYQLAICARTRTNLAIVYIDLDGFKAVNDVHGHAAGDEVLRTVATRLKSTIRETDLVARLGGDEFAAILMQAGLEAGEAIAAKLIERLSNPYPVGALTLKISASIGIAGYPESGTTSEALTRRADDAMYEAKAAGKRRYAVAGATEK